MGRENRKMRLYTLGIVMFLVILSSTLAIAEGVSDIRVTLLNQDPDPVEQRDVVEVRFKVENAGKQTLDDISILLLPAYPFTLYSGSPIRHIGKLPSSQSGSDAVIVDYKLRVDANAAEGDNEIELQVLADRVVLSEFTDNEFQIDVAEFDEPEIQVYIRDKTIIKSDERGTIGVEIANVDIADVKFLQLTLLPNENYELLSPSNYVYIGDVDSDDTESEEFEIYVKNAPEGIVLLSVRIEYQDTNEHKYEKGFDLELRVYDPDELSRFDLEKRSYTKQIILGVILLIIIYIVWKRKKK